MTLSETTHRVIDLAREVRDYYETELPKWHRDYPLVNPGEGDPPPPPAEAELQSLLASLPREVLYQLLLIIYLGRGYFGTEDLADRYEELRSGFAKPAYAASQMMAYKATLADQLSDGLEELRAHGIDVDRMPLKKVKARKR